MDPLPGQETLLASWHALTQLSPGAHVRRRDRLTAAVFPAWEPLNNAILQGPATLDRAAAAAQEAGELYRSVGIPTWALWVPSPVADLDTQDTRCRHRRNASRHHHAGHDTDAGRRSCHEP